MPEPMVQDQAAAQDGSSGCIKAAIETSEADDFTPMAAERYPQHVGAPPATMAEFMARGDHRPRGHWMEPAWSDDITAALRPPPLYAGESLTQYLQLLKCHTDGFKPDRIKAWQVNQDFTDSKLRQVRSEGRASAPNMQIFERAQTSEHISSHSKLPFS